MNLLKNMAADSVFRTPCDFPYCSFDFLDWNPVQMKCTGFFTKDCNLVVSASTASGKTAIAEAIMSYELCVNDEAKAVYVSPLKAIGSEKYARWMKHDTFSKYVPLLVSSDSPASQSEFESSRLVVSTVESMLMRCRLRDRWISSVRVLVVDEAHLIGDAERGAACESLVMSLSMLNPSTRILMLSGTMGNCIEMAKWLKRCNGKETHFVNSSWRPCELAKRVITANTFQEQERSVFEIVKKSKDGIKILVFVNSKKTGERISKQLRRRGIIAPFFHAGLGIGIRKRMIDDFKSKYSNVNVLICTSSLSMGINL
ncbi:MAG: DEAD/DEAH box helicase [Victivallales bacterium]|nr:DEAD/DEAH box helicase [Victivallales bacterium]